jgi:hypothetical protein
MESRSSGKQRGNGLLGQDLEGDESVASRRQPFEDGLLLR